MDPWSLVQELYEPSYNTFEIDFIDDQTIFDFFNQPLEPQNFLDNTSVTPHTSSPVQCAPTSLKPAGYLPPPPASSPHSQPETSFTGSNTLKRKLDQVAFDETRQISVKGAEGADRNAFQVSGTTKTRRGAYEQDKRDDVAYTRKVKACERCSRKKCACGRSKSPYEMCNGCISLKNPLSLRLPCFLESLTDAQLFRYKASANHPLYFPRANIYDLRDPSFLPADMHIVHLTQGTGEELVINIARFLPQAGDKTAYVWTTANGSVQMVEMPPYCIVQVEDAKTKMLDYIQRSRNAYISTLQVDNIATMVLEEARRFAVFNPASTVRKALDLLAADRIIERDWILCGNDSSDIPYVFDPDNTSYSKRPITPMMDCQLDQVVIQGFLQPLRKDLLEQLQTDINTARQERWYDIFLTTFVLLANAEQLLAHSRRNAIRHGAKGRYNSPELASLYFHACKMFISHFRFVCNFKGFLSINWRSSKTSAMARLDSEQISFLRNVQSIAQSKGDAMLRLRREHEFEQPSYWTHQIMYDDWNAGDLDAERFHINNAPVACAF